MAQMDEEQAGLCATEVRNVKPSNPIARFFVEKFRQPAAAAVVSASEMIPLAERKRKGVVKSVEVTATTTTDDLAAADEDKKRNQRRDDLRVYFTMILICVIAAIVTLVKIALQKLIESGHLTIEDGLIKIARKASNDTEELRGDSVR